MTELRGKYQIVNIAFMREKAARKHDPRHEFYEALLASKTYEEYLAQVGRKEFVIPGYKAGPINGRMEILYARRNGWIADA